MKLKIIACEVFKDELDHICDDGLECVYLPQGYHRTPEKMPAKIQEEVDRLDGSADYLALGYGLCSNGVVGVKARKTPLVVPRTHDCIALLLGSREAYVREFSQHPGTYYLTPGWIEYGQNPYSEYLENWIEEYGEETAKWLAVEFLKNYTRISYIENGITDQEKFRDFAKEMAEFYGFRYSEIEGNLEYLLRLLNGSWDSDFLVIQPGDTIGQGEFLIESTIPLL